MSSKIQVTGQPITDIAAGLLAPTFKGVPFPLTHIHTSGGNDLVEHKRPDMDGYHVENMGGNNLVFTASIPFRNGIIAGATELWDGVLLYPTVFKAFLKACADGSSGTLIHPELGSQTVKCHRFDWEQTADRRDGCDFQVEWIQSLNDDALISSISQTSPVSTAISLATQMDNQLAAINPLPTELVSPPLASFADMMRSLQAIPDTASLLSKQLGGILHKIAAQVERVLDAFVNLNNVRYWPIVEGLNHLQSSVFDLQARFAVNQRPMREYIVRTETTLSFLAQLLKNKIDDLMRLNPLLLEKPTVPANARVRYYK